MCAVALLGCGGSGFTPEPGPFTGDFVDGETVLGSFSFTVTGDLIGGTGTLMHNAAQVNVSLSGVISDKSISGQVTNVSVGAGEFTGSFRGEDAALGTFEFLDNVDQERTSGTWVAAVE
jgi:hypothetical protein